MADEHRIRLRGAWNVIDRGPDGSRRIARRFGSPRELDPCETIWLSCEYFSEPTTISINGTVIAASVVGPFVGEITAVMKPRNEVCLETGGEGEIGEIALVFRATG